MSDRSFTHPDYGKAVRVEQHGHEVHLILVVSNQDKADKLAENLVEQLESGSLNLTLIGNPPRVVG